MTYTFTLSDGQIVDWNEKENRFNINEVQENER